MPGLLDCPDELVKEILEYVLAIDNPNTTCIRRIGRHISAGRQSDIGTVFGQDCDEASTVRRTIVRLPTKHVPKNYAAVTRVCTRLSGIALEVMYDGDKVFSVAPEHLRLLNFPFGATSLLFLRRLRLGIWASVGSKEARMTQRWLLDLSESNARLTDLIIVVGIRKRWNFTSAHIENIIHSRHLIVRAFQEIRRRGVARNMDVYLHDCVKFMPGVLQSIMQTRVSPRLSIYKEPPRLSFYTYIPSRPRFSRPVIDLDELDYGRESDGRSKVQHYAIRRKHRKCPKFGMSQKFSQSSWTLEELDVLSKPSPKWVKDLMETMSLPPLDESEVVPPLRFLFPWN